MLHNFFTFYFMGSMKHNKHFRTNRLHGSTGNVHKQKLEESDMKLRLTFELRNAANPSRNLPLNVYIMRQEYTKLTL